jgi:hypothetical protein
MQQMDWAEQFKAARSSAVHLEMRDLYGIASEVEPVHRFKETGWADTDPDSTWWRPWTSVVRGAVGRGVTVRRARIVSEPVTDYIRWEHAITPANLAAGELVRWLPRTNTSDLALPGNDLWLFDQHTVLFNLFTGDGDIAGYETRTEPEVVKLVSDAFEAIWDRATPHDQYVIR